MGGNHCFFLKNARETLKKARVFLFAEPLKSLENKGKAHQKSKGNWKTRTAKKSKRQGLEGQGGGLLQ